MIWNLQQTLYKSLCAQVSRKLSSQDNKLSVSTKMSHQNSTFTLYNVVNTICNTWNRSLNFLTIDLPIIFLKFYYISSILFIWAHIDSKLTRPSINSKIVLSHTCGTDSLCSSFARGCEIHHTWKSQLKWRIALKTIRPNYQDKICNIWNLWSMSTLHVVFMWDTSGSWWMWA